jgi:hypothetical protein
VGSIITLDRGYFRLDGIGVASKVEACVVVSEL